MEKSNQAFLYHHDILLLFNRFEQILINSKQPDVELSQLTSPQNLHFLVYLRIIKSIKLGPDNLDHENLNPGKILKIVQDSISEGIFFIHTLTFLKVYLKKLENRLLKKEMWHPAQPFWWQPIPPDAPLEKFWKEIEPIFENKEITKQLSAFSNRQINSKRWIWLPRLLPLALLNQLIRELKEAERNQLLDLQREGVGQSNLVSSKRTDLVQYLSGTERELLKTLPVFSGFVQLLLCQFIHRLKVILSDTNLSAPEKVMLTRYPAPSGGFNAHLDNPGGDQENSRAYTLIIYLNDPEMPCNGGELAIWNKKELISGPPSEILPAKGGAAIMFDSRAIPHQVLPLKKGAARWALVLWLKDRSPDPLISLIPKLTLTDVLLPIKNPSLPSQSILFHELNGKRAEGRLVNRKINKRPVRIGIVSTVYQSRNLESWCRYHYSIGVDHLVLIFDHLEEPSEDVIAKSLRKLYGPERLTIWSGETIKSRWKNLPEDFQSAKLHQFTSYGASAFAISARQTLNASVALLAAKTNEFGGTPLDWLLHLDDDELFYMEGADRGGALLKDHFNAMDDSDIHLVRYLNHELLLPFIPKEEVIFKLNPRLAEVFLGSKGWKKLAQYLKFSDMRPYFHGYRNGKSAVCVKHGFMAAGMHSWSLKNKSTVSNSKFLAGPSVLHFRFPNQEAFIKKYIKISNAPFIEGKKGLFNLSGLEKSAVLLIQQLRDSGTGEDQIKQQLGELFVSLKFSDDEIETLEMAGLTISPKGLPPEMIFD